jgi:MFS family permease
LSLQQIREHIEGARMNGWQWLVVSLGVLINMLDGFDLLAASLVAPVISDEWHLSQSTLGVLLGAVSLGTAFGAFALSAIADIWGRRTAILINLCLMSVGMLVSSRANSVELLVAMRFLTGMGVGAMAGCVGVLIFEYSAVRNRNLALGMVVVGYNVGGVLGALFAREFLDQYSWGALFVLGGVLTVILIPVIYFVMPESWRSSRRPIRWRASTATSRTCGCHPSRPCPCRHPRR